MKKPCLLGFITLTIFSIIGTACGPAISKPPSVSSTTSLITSETGLSSFPSATKSTAGNITTTISTVPSTVSMYTSSSEVPALYLLLYNQLQGYVTNEDQQISSQWDGSVYPVNYATELLTADTNAGPNILTSNERQMMMEELDGEVGLGVKAVTVEIGFPVFDPNFYISTGQTAAQAQQTVQTWIDYYQSLAQAIHSRGLKMIVESNPLLTYYISSQSSFNPGSYYKALDFATYEQLRSEHNIILAQQIKPDYLLLQTEPQTDAVNDFRPELDIASKDTAMISKHHSFYTDIVTTIINSFQSIWFDNHRRVIIILVSRPNAYEGRLIASFYGESQL